MSIKMTTDARIIKKFPQEIDIDEIRECSTCYEIINNGRKKHISFTCYDICRSDVCGLNGCKPIPDAKKMIIDSEYNVKFS